MSPEETLRYICEETGHSPEDFTLLRCPATQTVTFRLTPKAHAHDEFARTLWRRKARQLAKGR